MDQIKKHKDFLVSKLRQIRVEYEFLLCLNREVKYTVDRRLDLKPIDKLSELDPLPWKRLDPICQELVRYFERSNVIHNYEVPHLIASVYSRVS